MKSYYSDDLVTLYHGDSREITDWLAADVLVTDPPYGIGWKRHGGGVNKNRGDRHEGIVSDNDTSARDAALTVWGDRPGLVFGSFFAPAPPHRHLLVYRKPPDSGVLGSTTGWRRDLEPVYLTGPWPKRAARWSSLLETATRASGSPSSPAGRYGHPHAKPVDVMEQLIDACPPGVVAEPFAGSGSTLVAARNLGRRAIGVELDERYCETIATRLSQGAFDFGAVA
ncbi:Site-specific DNA-methyltransferase (adenine-spe cific) [Micromonospora saelicesensis]|uniref:Methyltransferase n=1 Tax=Micromonospora saelicesensis TaxID=285676 RepID=A0ABX9CAY6_9ACTN|nr:site-specific DNA-methyltransferase [Micromonospora saelicesensis]RAN92640.1 Site-specific DNA-methyltransferase (adenine-spe cific) [Micromonospora saelicesensis]